MRAILGYNTAIILVLRNLIRKLLGQNEILSSGVEFFGFQQIPNRDLQGFDFLFHLGDLNLQEGLLGVIDLVDLLLGFLVFLDKTGN